VERTTAALGEARDETKILARHGAWRLHVAQQQQLIIQLHLATSARLQPHVSKGLIRRPQARPHFIPVYSSSPAACRYHLSAEINLHLLREINSSKPPSSKRR